MTVVKVLVPPIATAVAAMLAAVLHLVEEGRPVQTDRRAET
jgi:hypothetical protein